MTKAERQAERRIVGRVATSVRKSHPNAWWELKRQVWDGGLQSFYPAQQEFDSLIDHTLRSLSAAEITVLNDELSKGTATQAIDDWVTHYRHVVTEELVRRAVIAAYRTENW